MSDTPVIINTLIADPTEMARLANLRYVRDEQLTIRRKKWGKGYIYLLKDKKISDPAEIERFNSLVIPPAWKKVRIAQLPNAHLQVVGRDTKNRKVYRYHDIWTELRNQTKFLKMASFGSNLPKIRAQVESDLDQKGMPQSKVLALVLRLMEETHIRIGNDYYAKKNKTYGLSTLRTRHVETFNNKMKFHFIGKKGKEHDITVRNKRLLKLVHQCEEIPGWELFQYYDDQGNKHRIDSGMINDYIHQISGDLFSAKDFRTWGASKVFFETVHEIGYKEDEKENAAAILAGIDAAAEALGNTRSVCRTYYVHPQIVHAYEDGSIVNAFNKVEDTSDGTNLSATERVLLEMISEFQIELSIAS